MSSGIIWQSPHVNIFKHFGIGKWKKCTKEGEVSTSMDRDIKATVFRISGSIPASNYILIPKTSSQSLNLTGTFFMIVFRPLPSKYFVVHLEVVTSAGLVVRISFSNLFKEFKSTSTWLQFPFKEGLKVGSGEDEGKDKLTRWTFLSLNMKEILSKYLFSNFSYLKNIKLCANILVKNAFTSDIEYCPLASGDKDQSQCLYPVPREMSLPLPKDMIFLDLYDYICFPCEEKKLVMLNQQKLKTPSEVVLVASPMGEGTRYTSHVTRGGAFRQLKSTRGETQVCYHVVKDTGRKSGHVNQGNPNSSMLADHMIDTKKHRSPQPKIRIEGEVDGDSEGVKCDVGGAHEKAGDLSSGRDESVFGGESVHVYAEEGAELTIYRGNDPKLKKKITIKKAQSTSLHPDPILQLHRVIGFGGATTHQALFGEGGTSIIYPCHSLVVAMDIASGKQRFFTGHTQKVSCISLNVDGSLLASGQVGSPAVVRVWEMTSTKCLALFQSHHQGLHSLSFSCSSNVLCGVGRDKNGRTQVVLWDTSQLRSMGEVSILTKAHTESSVERMRVAAFESHRLVSCGLNNVRFWRVKGGALRSCPVDLGEHHHMHFTDIQFQPGLHRGAELADKRVYACTDSGHLFEINYTKISVQRVWHLLPDLTIHSLSLHGRTFCVTGSEDGILRVWPMDFSSVFMETEHEGEVTVVDISEDGLKVLAGTTAGNLGILDASTRCYSTLMRSHAGHVTSMSVSGHSPGHLVTSSNDHTIRVWDLPGGPQTFDFRTLEDCASCVCTGPRGNVFACGFNSGAVRVFQLPSAKMVAQHSHHSGCVTGVVYSPLGHLLYSSSSMGSLALYSCQESHTPKLLRLVSNIMAKGEELGPRALTLNQDGSRLAFIGPHNFTITVLEAESLTEVLRVDITSVTTPTQTKPFADSARLVCFSPAALNQLLLITKQARLLKFSATNGELLSEVGHTHSSECSSAVASDNGRYLLTAGDQVIKVWDYAMALDLNFQVFIGHCGEISQVLFSTDGRHVISCGDAIFIWDFLGVACDLTSLPATPPKATPTSPPLLMTSGLQSASPRKQVPAPAAYDPLKMQSFTPMGYSSQLGAKGVDISDVFHSKDELVLNVDDDKLYEVHDKGEGEGPISPRKGANINKFCNRVISGLGSDDESSVEVEEGEDPMKIDTIPPVPVSPVTHSPKDTSHTATPPSATVHLLPPLPRSERAPRLYVAPNEEAGLQRSGVCSISSLSRNNVVWHPSSGVFVFSSGCLVVAEDLTNGRQRHMEGHLEEISTLALDHFGSTLASAGAMSKYTPCEIRIWNLATAKCTNVLTFHSCVVQSMSYSPDDRFLLSIGNYQDGSMALWSARDYSLLAATSLSHPVHDHCWDPYTAYEFTTVGVGQKGGGVCFWMVEEDMGGKECQFKVHEPRVPKDLLEMKTVSNLEFTSVYYGSQPTVFVGSNNGVVSLWDTTHNTCLLFWRTMPSEITCMLVVGDKVLTGNAAGTLQLWAVDSSTTPPVVTLSSSMEVDSGAISSASFSKNMELGVVGSASGSAWYINWAELSKLKLIGGHSGEISSIAFSSGDSSPLLASSSLDGSLAVWRPDTREQMVLFRAPNKACCCVVFSPAPQPRPAEGKPPPLPVLMAGYSDGTVRVFDVEAGKMLRKVQPHAKPVKAVAYFNDGNVVMSGCSAGLVAISNLASGLVIRVITDHQGAPITDLQTAPKPIQLPSLGAAQCMLWLVASGDRRVSLWSADWQRDTCQLVDWLTFPAPSTAPDGTRLGKRVKGQYSVLPPSLARFSPCDPDTIVYSGYGLERAVQFYSISSKAVFRTLSLTHWPTCFAVSPQSHLLAFGCHERVLKLMDYEEGAFQDFTGHHDTVGSLAFSPCGTFLVSTSQSIIHFWKIILQ